MNHTFTVTPHLVETQVLCLYTSKKLTHSSSHNATNSNHNCNFLTGPINYTPFLVNRVHLVSFHPLHQDTKSCICECISIVWFFWLWLVSEHVTLLVFKTVDVIISIILYLKVGTSNKAVSNHKHKPYLTWVGSASQPFPVHFSVWLAWCQCWTLGGIRWCRTSVTALMRFWAQCMQW